jgi:hypothetical protein
MWSVLFSFHPFLLLILKIQQNAFNADIDARLLNSTVRQHLWAQGIPSIRVLNRPFLTHPALTLYLPHHRHPEYLSSINNNLRMNSSSVQPPLPWLMPFTVQLLTLSHRYIPTISPETIVRIMSASIVLMQNYLARLDHPSPPHHQLWLVLVYMILNRRHHG